FRSAFLHDHGRHTRSAHLDPSQTPALHHRSALPLHPPIFARALPAGAAALLCHVRGAGDQGHVAATRDRPGGETARAIADQHDRTPSTKGRRSNMAGTPTAMVVPTFGSPALREHKTGEAPTMEVNENLSDKARYDLALVRRAVDNNDQKAYAELMQRYRDSIYFMLLKMINNKDDAD